MRNDFKLEEGQELKIVNYREKGHLGQTEIYDYEILNQNKEIIGKARKTETTQVRGFASSTHIEQWDLNGEKIFENIERY
ncbi:hypothetical protein OZX61_12785 (plasmid) [Acinetobacter sp. ESL0695]|uniref:hypothetical protein n=1 Tax=Acinetobacter sp. ESL0695 TaxID=2983215 RepID=UPI0023F00EF4|nr:hypothetical protein [Acinetobacter sp. ESL0695]WEV50218.1 hypothetical protein OZX61_12785 [Acinetobacter sp. ESL0695]